MWLSMLVQKLVQKTTKMADARINKQQSKGQSDSFYSTSLKDASLHFW